MTRRKHARFVFILNAFLLSGCLQQPSLLFGSEETLGVAISVSSASTTPVSLTLGYKSLDASLVPVATNDQTNGYHSIRGCSNTAISGQFQACTEDLAAPAQIAPKRSVSLNTDQLLDRPELLRVATKPRQTIQPFALPIPPPTGSRSNIPAAATGGGQESLVDALSVFSSFNAKAGASTATGADVGLGKVFATGVAAQQLGQAQNYYLQYKGQALVYTIQQCLANLLQAKGAGNVTSADIQTCKPGS
jgi:hypothetical protein